MEEYEKLLFFTIPTQTSKTNKKVDEKVPKSKKKQGK